jgi:hypothetical protein
MILCLPLPPGSQGSRSLRWSNKGGMRKLVSCIRSRGEEESELARGVGKCFTVGMPVLMGQIDLREREPKIKTWQINLPYFDANYSNHRTGRRMRLA